MMIRKAKLLDLEKIIELNRQLFHYDYKFDKTLDLNWSSKNKGYYKKAILGTNSIVLVAILEDNIVGYIIASIIKAEDYRRLDKLLELENMYVLDKYRGKGIGSKLINEALEWGRMRKIKRARLVASAKNTRAIEVYKKNLFSEYNITLEKKI